MLARLAITLSPPGANLPFLSRCFPPPISDARFAEKIGVCSIRSQAFDRQKNPSRHGGSARKITTDSDFRCKKSVVGLDKDLRRLNDLPTE